MTGVRLLPRTRSSKPEIGGELGWQAFIARYFPNTRRHDLEPLTAYGAYKRAHGRQANPDRVASAAVDAWEEEGGAIVRAQATRRER